ncbi:MAG: hypothetical protein A2328_01455 [Bdellovibrionales bacterium RIFOXYB2_FULL_36_6]|nr:MAG: hypothetical protein A2328_01455 [Bdellovibrionales bacterium RIFOXYB2_FULL_36_6]
MTDKKIIINSGMVKKDGWKIPFLATSIIPAEKVTPNKRPRLATIKITLYGAALEPMEEFKKLTASLVTPTVMSKIANKIKTITPIKKIFVSIFKYLQELGLS